MKNWFIPNTFMVVIIQSVVLSKSLVNRWSSLAYVPQLVYPLRSTFHHICLQLREHIIYSYCSCCHIISHVLFAGGDCWSRVPSPKVQPIWRHRGWLWCRWIVAKSSKLRMGRREHFGPRRSCPDRVGCDLQAINYELPTLLYVSSICYAIILRLRKPSVLHHVLYVYDLL